MATLPEITDLFSRLARTLNSIEDVDDDEEEKKSINLSISKLNKSLNLTEDYRVPILEAALSLMCFKSPKVYESVFDSVVDYSVKTIASFLSSSVSCQALGFGNEQILRIGSSIPGHDCEQLIQSCVDILEKLRGHYALSPLSPLLLVAAVRVVVSTSCYQLSFPCTLYLDEGSVDRSSDLSQLLCYLPRELSLDNKEIPLRLLFWYLDPLTLKRDISKILQDYMNRPFLCLSKEFHERVDWHAIVVRLALSPIMFIETRALLHDWFLLTGLASILELVIGLVSVILDINLTPTLWGISLELGSQLPFSGAYFPNNKQLLRTFAGPFTTENFLHLVHATSKPVFHATKRFVPTIPSETKVATIDHRSIWALAINFPGWFYFASILLFSDKGVQEKFHSKCTIGAPKVGQIHEMEALSAAARYIAWILSPNDKSEQGLLVEYLNKIAEAWTLKLFGSSENHKEESWHLKKLKKPKFHENKEDYTSKNEYDCQMIGLWLEEVQSMYKQYSAKAVENWASCEARRSYGFNLQRSMLFRQIPLGILVGYSNCIEEEGCELLLHSAATGRIIKFRDANSSGLKRGSWTSLSKEDSVMLLLEFSKKEAIAGACLVFGLTDISESMFTSLAETEERASDFICQMKLKTGKYLIKCVKRLIQLSIDKDGIEMLMDLSSRLVRWRHQGQEVVEFDKDLKEVINVLSNKLSPI
ncbi:Acyl-CoA synthetase family protein [Citrus sinensis]|nr:Acyl-CoA synthetase family protein [Citrus sinensis]